MESDIDASNVYRRTSKIVLIGDCRVLTIGKTELWDGVDMAFLRESMRRLIEDENCLMLGIDMNFVRYVPSGFFGLLCHWYDEGARIRLFSPLPNVKQMPPNSSTASAVNPTSCVLPF